MTKVERSSAFTKLVALASKLSVSQGISYSWAHLSSANALQSSYDYRPLVLAGHQNYVSSRSHRSGKEVVV